MWIIKRSVECFAWAGLHLPIVSGSIRNENGVISGALERLGWVGASCFLFFFITLANPAHCPLIIEPVLKL